MTIKQLWKKLIIKNQNSYQHKEMQNWCHQEHIKWALAFQTRV